MISKDSIKRPSAKVVLNHPFFWNEERMLGFLQVKFFFFCSLRVFVCTISYDFVLYLLGC